MLWSTLIRLAAHRVVAIASRCHGPTISPRRSRGACHAVSFDGEDLPNGVHFCDLWDKLGTIASEKTTLMGWHDLDVTGRRNFDPIAS